MVRSIVIPKKKVFSIEVPESYVGKRVEVIAFAVEEVNEELPSKGKTELKQFQAVSIATKGFKFNREEANER
jgi:hypothetical protein